MSQGVCAAHRFQLGFVVGGRLELNAEFHQFITSEYVNGQDITRSVARQLLRRRDISRNTTPLQNGRRDSSSSGAVP